MKEIEGWILTFVYVAIAMSLMQARRPKFSRSIGTGDIPLQWFRLNDGDMESMFVKTAYFGAGATFKECGFAVPDQCLEKMVAILLLTKPRADGSTLVCITQSFATRIYDEMWAEFETKGGAVKWLDKRSWIATADDDMMANQVDALTVTEGGLSCIVTHQADNTGGNRTRYDVTLGFQDSL
jgi:hypothetical protein